MNRMLRRGVVTLLGMGLLLGDAFSGPVTADEMAKGPARPAARPAPRPAPRPAARPAPRPAVRPAPTPNRGSGGGGRSAPRTNGGGGVRSGASSAGRGRSGGTARSGSGRTGNAGRSGSRGRTAGNTGRRPNSFGSSGRSPAASNGGRRSGQGRVATGSRGPGLNGSTAGRPGDNQRRPATRNTVGRRPTAGTGRIAARPTGQGRTTPGRRGPAVVRRGADRGRGIGPLSGGPTGGPTAGGSQSSSLDQRWANSVHQFFNPPPPTPTPVSPGDLLIGGLRQSIQSIQAPTSDQQLQSLSDTLLRPSSLPSPDPLLDYLRQGAGVTNGGGFDVTNPLGSPQPTSNLDSFGGPASGGLGWNPLDQSLADAVRNVYNPPTPAPSSGLNSTSGDDTGD